MSSDPGITLVAVHGNGGGGFRFARAEPHLPTHIRFEAVTLPGFGGRPADPALRTLSDYAEQLWQEICELPRPLVVLGHGIGGSIALDMVQRHPVDGLMLHAPVGTRLERRWFPRLMRPEPVRSLIKWGISSPLTRPLVGRRFFDTSVPRDYVAEFLAEYGRAASFSQMFDVITADWWTQLEPVDVPALMLWGSNDRVLGADQVDDYRALLHRTAIDVVAGWGHFPMVDDPENYARVVADWAERLVRNDAGPLRIGSGLLADADVGPKASLLDRARRAGLPVPPAAVVGPDTTAVPAWLSGRIAVRSAFSSEDGTTSSNAGRFTTVLDVDRTDDEATIGALHTVRTSADDSVVRADVLVMDMVAAVTAGVAFTEPGWEDDLVEWTHGLADQLVAGAADGTVVELPRLRRGERPGPDLEGWERRLATLLRDLRDVFGECSNADTGDDANGWDVEWADDGTTCWLLQVRPITAPLLRNERFTIANHKEILPDPPSVFMTSLIAEGSPRLFDWYRRFDPELATRRHFIEVFDGRPLINLSLMTDFIRSLGLPTRLITDSIGGVDDHGTGLRLTRVMRRLPVLARLGLSQLDAVGFARRTAEHLRTASAAPAADFTTAVDRAGDAYVATVHAMTALNTAASLPTSLLRRLGLLEEHAARTETAATRMFRDLDAVRAELTELRSNGTEAVDTDDPTATPALQHWLDRYGHRGIYESDLSRPRYAEQPAPIVAAARTPPARRSPPGRTIAGWLTLPLWLAARRPITAREGFRSEAMRSFLAVRRDLLRLADGIAIDHEALWLLEAAEVRSLDTGWRPDGPLLTERRAAQDRQRAHPTADVIRRFDPPATDIDDSGRGDRTPDQRGDVQGMGLVAGEISGRAWVLTEPEHELPDGFDRESTVLVAHSVDPGWIATFGQVAGVAIELGGDLSHGSIVLRELGLPSVTNANGLVQRVRTGDRIHVDGRRGRVRVEHVAR